MPAIPKLAVTPKVPHATLCFFEQPTEVKVIVRNTAL
jgi:hypothetical protein